MVFMRYGFLTFLSFVIFSVQAQGDYAVLTKGDTVRGELSILTYDLIDRIQIKGNGKKQMLTALQVRRIMIDQKIFQPVRMDNKIRLMQLHVPGFLSLYGFAMANQSVYDGRFLVKLGGESLEVPNLAFKRVMTTFLEDCPSVVKKIKDGAWGKNELDSIVLEYNRCVAQKPGNPGFEQVTKKDEDRLKKIEVLRAKVSASAIGSKQDITDLLMDISQKIEKHQPVPNYLVGSLKSYLGEKPEFATELNDVLELLKD